MHCVFKIRPGGTAEEALLAYFLYRMMFSNEDQLVIQREASAMMLLMGWLIEVEEGDSDGHDA